MDGASLTGYDRLLADLRNRDQRDGIQPRGSDGRWVAQDVHEAVEKHNEGKRKYSGGRGQASHLTLPRVDAEDFCDALNNAGHSREESWMVDKKQPTDLVGAKCFLSDDKMCGVAVKPDGDIVGLFKNPESDHRNAVVECMFTAIRNGGTHGDCYMNEQDGRGLHTLYQGVGMHFASGTDFFADYAPEGWKEGMAEPPVGFFNVPKNLDIKEAGRRAGLPESRGGFHVETLAEIQARCKKSGTWHGGKNGYGKAGEDAAAARK